MEKENLQNYIFNELIYPKKIPLTAFFEDMSPAEFTLIAAFTNYEAQNAGNHITVNELASSVNVSVPAVSRTLKNLEERKLITRVTNNECRRNTFVVISDKGKKLFEANKQKAKFLLDKIMDSFTTEEIMSVIKFHHDMETLINNECKSILK